MTVIRRSLLLLLSGCCVWTTTTISAFVVLPLSQQSPVRLSFAAAASDKNDNNNNNNNNNNNDDDDEANPADRTTFDQAGASLIEEEDRKRMEEMGDFDANPAYQNDNIEQMRAAIRARTQDLGLEKSKVSAEYIQTRQEQAQQVGAQQDREDASNAMFGGVDLSKISNDGTGTTTDWDEDMPTMFFDPDDELTMEERQEVDPVMTKNVIEQGMNELTNAKWPTLAAAGREVVLMAAVVAFSGALIIGADTALRTLYTDVLKFIPSADELANYAQRFDGLDLPTGWMENMSENDLASLADQVNPADAAAAASSSSLPPL